MGKKTGFDIVGAMVNSNPITKFVSDTAKIISGLSGSSGGGGNYGGSSGGGGSGGSGSRVDYSIGTDKGRDIANSLATGQTYNCADGSTWRKNADGTLSVTQKDGFVTRDTYFGGTQTPVQGMPSVQAPDDYMDVQREQNRLAAEREEQARRLYDSQVQQGTDRFNAQRGDVNRSYEDAARQAYISYMQGQRAIPGQLAAAGITGGAAESTVLGAQTAYQGSLSSIDTAKQKAMSDIDMAITDLRNSGDIQKAQYIMANRDKIAEQFTQNAFAQIARTDQRAQQNREFDFQSKLHSDDQAFRDKSFNADQQQYMHQQALGMASLGYSAEQIAALLHIPLDQAKLYASGAIRR